MSMQEVFSDRGYCMEELGRIRETWGNKIQFTQKAVEAIRTTLAWMFLYCPIEIQDLVEYHMEELNKREWYVMIRPVPTEVGEV